MVVVVVVELALLVEMLLQEAQDLVEMVYQLQLQDHQLREQVVVEAVVILHYLMAIHRVDQVAVVVVVILVEVHID